MVSNHLLSIGREDIQKKGDDSSTIIKIIVAYEPSIIHHNSLTFWDVLYEQNSPNGSEIASSWRW